MTFSIKVFFDLKLIVAITFLASRFFSAQTSSKINILQKAAVGIPFVLLLSLVPQKISNIINSTNLSNLVTETGIAIMRKPRISYTDYPLINRLVEQAQIQDYMFPVVLHGLRLRPEPNNPDFYHGLSLEYTDRSELMLAPSLKNGRHMSSTKLSLQEILKGTKADENNLAVFSYALILPHVSAYTFGFRLSNIDREIGQLSIYQLNEYPHGRVVLMKRL